MGVISTKAQAQGAGGQRGGGEIAAQGEGRPGPGEQVESRELCIRCRDGS